MSQSALRVLYPSNTVEFGGGEGITERPSFLRQRAPTLDSRGDRLKPAQSIQKLGTDKSKQTVECQPGFLFNIFLFVTAFIIFPLLPLQLTSAVLVLFSFFFPRELIKMLKVQHLVLFILLNSTFAFVRGKMVLSATDISASIDERRAYGL